MYREPLGTEPAPLVVTAFNENVIALDAKTGAVAWRKGVAVARIVIDGSVVLVADRDARLMALDYLTGQQVWSVSLRISGSASVTLLSTPDAIFVSFGGEIACVTRKGELLWRNTLAGTGYGAPEIAIPGAVAHGDHSG
jgi:outer membrane protein assembly factor BamB